MRLPACLARSSNHVTNPCYLDIFQPSSFTEYRTAKVAVFGLDRVESRRVGGDPRRATRPLALAGLGEPPCSNMLGSPDLIWHVRISQVFLTCFV